MHRLEMCAAGRTVGKPCAAYRMRHKAFFVSGDFERRIQWDCTQDAPLHFTESDDNQPSRKKSRKTAHRLHDTVNRGTMQSIRAEGRYFTNPASIDFFRLISRHFCPKISANPVRLESVHSLICKTVLAKTSRVKSILMTGGRECLPPFLTDRMDLYAI